MLDGGWGAAWRLCKCVIIVQDEAVGSMQQGILNGVPFIKNSLHNCWAHATACQLGTLLSFALLVSPAIVYVPSNVGLPFGKEVSHNDDA